MSETEESSTVSQTITQELEEKAFQASPPLYSS